MMKEDPALLLGQSTDKANIEALAREVDEMPEVTEDEDLGTTYYEFFQSGVGLQAEEATISTVFLYPGDRDGYQQYRGRLPEGLSWGDSRTAAHDRLSKPDATGEGKVFPDLGAMPPFDRYDLPTYSLHLSYGGEDGTLSLVTLMTPQTTPGRVL
jgi:hypothetical protein